MRPLKLAAYLDEAGEDPITGCVTLKSARIPYVALRHVWTNNVCNISDQSCQSLKEILKSHDINVLMVASELGLVPSNELKKIPKTTINRAFDIAQYFGAQYIRIFIGISSNDNGYIEEWMNNITEKSISSNIAPLLELSHGSAVYKPTDVAQLMLKNRRWKLLYDPAQLIIKQAQDPFVKYWTLLKQFVGVIDIHDFKIGHGHKPAGFGDAKIQQTLNDSTFNGWYFVEPGLGRKHGSALTRSDTFKLALEALDLI